MLFTWLWVHRYKYGLFVFCCGDVKLLSVAALAGRLKPVPLNKRLYLLTTSIDEGRRLSKL